MPYRGYQTRKRFTQPSGFGSLPNEILLKIFSNLSLDELCRAGRTCKNWNEATKHPHFWQRIDANVTDVHGAVKLIRRLPSSVTFLRISSSKLDAHKSLFLPDVTATLRQRCPELRTFVLERAAFQDTFCDAFFSTQTKNSQIVGCWTTETDITLEQYRLNTSCARCGGELNRDQFAPEKLPPRLRVISLKHCIFLTSNFACRLNVRIPQIRVLNLGYSINVIEFNSPFFSRLTNLRELYLPDGLITDAGIENLLKTVKGLKVLDLERTGASPKVFSVLKQYGQSLKELYLGGTFLGDSCLTYESEDTFKMLRKLCLRNTRVTPRGLVELLDLYPHLRTVDVSQCSVDDVWRDYRFRYMLDRLAYSRSSACDHFKENNHLN